MSDGEELVVLATDPASTIDMPHYCTTSGNELISSQRDGNTFIFTIRKMDRTS
jgi:tRNA 2-thiouridine synthesizing protein A